MVPLIGRVSTRPSLMWRKRSGEKLRTVASPAVMNAENGDAMRARSLR